MPVLVLERFGLESFSSNNGIVSLAPAIFGPSLSPLHLSPLTVSASLRKYLQPHIWQDLRLARPPPPLPLSHAFDPNAPPLPAIRRSSHSFRHHSSRPTVLRRISVLPSGIQDDDLYEFRGGRIGDTGCGEVHATREGGEEWGEEDCIRIELRDVVYIFAFTFDHSIQVALPTSQPPWLACSI